ncbi:extracellular solute-binding protein [Paenibacillus agaridevorans]|uniref:extracellular solute-binding protein n=1 Tax=Paenibacillus agaridevorans TaxID=171404 RepID=UPI001FE3FD37|nr:extracellular solute-binding protein [Paenibacillus agaridevorans]
MKSLLKAVLTVSLSAILATSLAACGSGNTSNNAGGNNTQEGVNNSTDKVEVYAENNLPKNEKVTLKVGFFEGGMGREWFDYAMGTFKEKFPNVSFDVTYSPSIQKITTTKIAANDDKDMFDLFSGSIAGGITSYVAAGKLESQEDLWDRAAYDGNGKTLKELSFEGSFESMKRTLGETYDFPISASGSGLMFNKTLFEENGWNQSPKTWSEFLELGDAIKAAGITPITFPGLYPNYIENALGNQKVYELAEINGNLDQVLDNYRNFKLPYYLADENVELWNRIFELGEKGYFPNGLAALNHTQSQMQVIQGKAAMVSTGTWVENEMKESTPDGFKWGYMTVPFGDDPESTKWTRFSPGSGFLMWTGKPDLNKQWSKEFIVWLWNLDNQAVIAEKGGMIPLRADFADDAERMGKLQSLSSAFLDYVNNNNIKMDSGNSNVVLTDAAFEQAKKVIVEATTEIASGKLAPLPTLEKAEALLEQAIKAQK